MEPPPPPGLLLLGGQSTEGQLTSVETFGFENCTIPPLPETRYGFGSFITPTQPPQLAVCGGWWMGKPTSTDCLTLNVTSGQWERGSFTNGLLGDGVRGVINFEGRGVYIIHSSNMSFLAPESKTWVSEPVFPTAVQCGCNVSDSSFVTIDMNDINNVREYSVANGNAEPIDVWPNLVTKRYGPGCGATSHHLLVAGGVSRETSGFDELLTSVEVFHVATKTRRKRGNMRQARAFFQIIPIVSTHPRLLLVGGEGAFSSMNTSEWWEEEENSWEEPELREGPALSTGRSSFAALMALPHLVCSEIEPPAHSCPAVQNTGQTCIFPTVESGLSMIITFWRHYRCHSLMISMPHPTRRYSIPIQSGHQLLAQSIDFTKYLLPRRHSPSLPAPRQRVHLPNNSRRLHQCYL